MPVANQIWTVGHSNRTIDEFLDILAAAGIERLADVRRFPGSRRYPQFGRDALAAALAGRDIEYLHCAGLGGRRERHSADSPNTAWEVDAFNAYADHMATSEFRQSLAELERAATEKRTTLMCAEAVHWRCHRRVLSDALIARGWEVFDIFGRGQVRPHKLTEFARVADGEVTYPGGRLF